MGTKVTDAMSNHQPYDPELWVEQHGDALYRYALMRLRDGDLAEEIVQETLLAALQARQKFAGQSSERTWLIGILKHKIVDHFRRSRREAPLENPELLSADASDELFRTSGEWVGHWKEDAGPSDWGADPSVLFDRKEFWEILQQGLASLPDRLAQVFILREVDGLETDEICRIMNISANNLWVMLHRARGQLRRYLEVNYFGQPHPQDLKSNDRYPRPAVSATH